MDFFTKNRMLFWCVGVLVLLNVVTLGLFWLGRPPLGPPGGPGGRPDSQRIMEEQLQLSDEQARQFELIRDEHFRRTVPLQDDMHQIRLDLLDEVFAAEPNDAAIRELTAQIGRRQGQFERELFVHFRELKAACDDRQMAELREMLADIIESTRPRDPRREPLGPDGNLGLGHPPGLDGDLGPGPPPGPDGDSGPGHPPPPPR
jgi:Spy/CpxP family protein refolding chaperone